jgi:hypothetical protein
MPCADATALRLHDGSERGAADADERSSDDQGAHGVVTFASLRIASL